MPFFEAKGIEKKYKDFTLSASFSIEEGEFLSIIGPSGSGKSTLLSLIAGIEDPDSGTITIGGKDITRERIQKRGIAMVFQDFSLFPSMNTERNIQFGMKEKDRAKRKELSEKLLLSRIKPYYLFQGDPVRGTAHLRTSISDGLEIEKELRKRLSGLGMPQYTIDLPKGGGKVILTHSYLICSDESTGKYIFETPEGGSRTYPE